MTDAVLALVVWRVSHLLVSERAPFALLSRFRRRIGIKANARSEMEAANEFAELFMCVWCLSMWIGWGIAFLHYRSWDFVVYGLAYSAVSCVLESVVNK